MTILILFGGLVVMVVYITGGVELVVILAFFFTFLLYCNMFLRVRLSGISK
jgi:hypothetical protein